MALLVVLALAGAFGDGPLSHAHISFPDGSTITLSRVMRSDNPERILLSGAAASATVTLAVDSATLGWLTIESSVPGAIAERRGAAQYEFDVRSASDGSVAVELVVTPHSIGTHLLRTQLGNGAWRNVRIVVLP